MKLGFSKDSCQPVPPSPATVSLDAIRLSCSHGNQHTLKIYTHMLRVGNVLHSSRKSQVYPAAQWTSWVVCAPSITEAFFHNSVIDPQAVCL